MIPSQRPARIGITPLPTTAQTTFSRQPVEKPRFGYGETVDQVKLHGRIRAALKEAWPVSSLTGRPEWLDERATQVLLVGKGWNMRNKQVLGLLKNDEQGRFALRDDWDYAAFGAFMKALSQAWPKGKVFGRQWLTEQETRDVIGTLLSTNGATWLDPLLSLSNRRRLGVERVSHAALERATLRELAWNPDGLPAGYLLLPRTGTLLSRTAIKYNLGPDARSAMRVAEGN